jgi:hypothetical protein
MFMLHTTPLFTNTNVYVAHHPSVYKHQCLFFTPPMFTNTNTMLFSENKLSTNFQHACREGHCTCTALMTDDWLKYMDNKMIVGAVLLDFSASFDVDHILLLKKLTCFGFESPAITWLEHYLSN